MQNLDVISVNLWQILVSLCNLLIIFLILKRFLYQPVKRILTTRQAELDGQYAAAREAQDRAEADRRAWDEKMQTAETEAAQILKKATERADRRGEQILSYARGRADSIIREAEMQAALEQRKAQSEIKQEIVDISALLTEKMLRREINTEDHRTMIDSVLSEIGEKHDGNQ